MTLEYVNKNLSENKKSLYNYKIKRNGVENSVSREELKKIKKKTQKRFQNNTMQKMFENETSTLFQNEKMMKKLGKHFLINFLPVLKMGI